MVQAITAAELKAALSASGEIALLDVREHGQYGEGHPFLAVPCPYSALELRLPRLVPCPHTRVVMFDADDGVASRAAARAIALGYTRVSILDGGAPAWAAAGYTLYKGVNVPSKAFGELLEEARHTPRVSAAELAALQASGAPLLIVDGRPLAEFRKMSIPGGVCCPNGELALRIGLLAPDPATTIVVNCAGRTRSILGAQTLIDVGIPNPVFALENGTQGWFLAGLDLDHGADRAYPPARPEDLAARQTSAAALGREAGVRSLTAATVADWLAESTRTTYLLDVRTAEEYARDGVAGTTHAPGGQLVQASDQWIGVRNARLVLLDDCGVRALVAARWLRLMGHDAHVLDDGVAAARGLDGLASPGSASRRRASTPPDLPRLTAHELALLPTSQRPQLIDLRASMDYRKHHIVGSVWASRAHLDRIALTAPIVALVASDADAAAYASLDLAARGVGDVRLLVDGPAAWRAAGLEVLPSDVPADVDCIDYLFFTHDRHDGNAAAARQYLAWELGLVAQLDAAERAVFRL